MDELTVGEAAQRTHWSPRMLRYLERTGLVVPRRTTAGYRLYGLAELNRLNALRELRRPHGVASTSSPSQRASPGPELRAPSTAGSPRRRQRLLDRLGAAQARAAARRLKLTSRRPNGGRTHGDATKGYDVKDLALAAEGERRIIWADRQMPVLRSDPRAVRRRTAARGITHRGVPPRHRPRPRTSCRTLKAGGAESCCAPRTRFRRRTTPRPRSSRISASPVFAIKGEDNDTLLPHIEAAVDHKPQLTMDDGADLDRRAAQRTRASSSPTSSPAWRRRRPASSA